MARRKADIPFDKSRYDAEYQRQNFRRIHVVLHKVHDVDILEHLQKVPNIGGYIKKLIRQDIQSGSGS